MIKKLLIFTLFFYFLVLLQTSFFVHFRIWGIVPNFVFIAVILLNLFEKPKDYAGLLIALVAGLFLDIFSQGMIGFYALILFSLSFFIKIILKRYVWAPLG